MVPHLYRDAAACTGSLASVCVKGRSRIVNLPLTRAQDLQREQNEFLNLTSLISAEHFRGPGRCLSIVVGHHAPSLIPKLVETPASVKQNGCAWLVINSYSELSFLRTSVYRIFQNNELLKNPRRFSLELNAKIFQLNEYRNSEYFS